MENCVKNTLNRSFFGQSCEFACVQPEVKAQAEAVLEKLGLPVSVLIDTLYRQIIMTGGVPYSLSVPHVSTFDSMSSKQFDMVMQKGFDEAKFGRGLSVE